MSRSPEITALGWPQWQEKDSVLPALGAMGAIDSSYQLFYDNADTYLSTWSGDRATLSLSVDGRINTLAIAPYMFIDGPASSTACPSVSPCFHL